MKLASMCTLLAALALLLGCDTDRRGQPSGPVVPLVQLGADDLPQYSDWSAPVNLGPVVNSDASDIEVTISKDGLSLYFASDRAGGFGRQDIYVSQRANRDDPWGPAQNLGPAVNTAFDDRAPALTRDGHRLYFASDRPGFGSFDLHAARRRDTRDDLSWRPAENLGGVVNTEFNENLPHSFEDEATGARTLYFNSGRPSAAPGTGRNDIYASTLESDDSFGPPVLVAELASPFREAKVEIRRDGLELFLTSDRTGTLGTFDVWVATRTHTADPWSTPVNVGPVINSVVDEGRIALSFDGTVLYVTGSRPGGLGRQDIWVSSRSKVKERD